MTEETRYVVLCVDDNADLLRQLVNDLETLWQGAIEINQCSSATEALVWANLNTVGNTRVPLIIVDHALEDMTGTDLLIRLHEFHELHGASKIILTEEGPLDFLVNALNRGALNGHLSRPWDMDSLHESTRHLLTEYFIEHAPDDLARFSHILDVGQISSALVSSEANRRAMSRELNALKKSFMDVRTLSDEEVEAAFIGEVDRLMDQPPRMHLAQGELLFDENESVDSVYVRLSGQASLFRTMDGEEATYHSASVGCIIGMLAFTYNRKTFFACRAESEVELIRIPHQTLDELLKSSPEFSLYFTTILMRASVKRNRRATELHVAIRELNKSLAHEKDQLAITLDDLKRAQMRLVESEKLATLGQLVSGVGHELNNPIAAIIRATDFTHQDVRDLALRQTDGEAFATLLEAGIGQAAQPTQERRAKIKTLARELGDRVLAKRLIKVGIEDKDTYEKLVPENTKEAREQRLSDLEKYFNLGRSLGNINTCANRIASLVTSLRSYARSSKEQCDDVDLLQGLEETLQLFGHKMKDIRVERDYGALPHISCRPGQVNQIWTNLISNAIQAMGEKGVLRLVTRPLEPNYVQVQVIDSGKGISTEDLDRIFEVNFTTKQGRVDFGLGLGLPICRDLAIRHGGRIEVTSEPGHTCFTVTLPITPPEHALEGVQGTLT